MSWAEAIHRLGSLLGHDEPTATEWIRQAVEARFGKDLTRTQRTLAFQKTCGAVLRLQDDEGAMLAFHPQARAVIQEAFARYFDGVAIEGPPWRLSPFEDLPLRDEWLAAAVDAI